MSKFQKELQRQNESNMSADDKNFYRNELKIFKELLSAKDLVNIRKHLKRVVDIESNMPVDYDFRKTMEAI